MTGSNRTYFPIPYFFSAPSFLTLPAFLGAVDSSLNTWRLVDGTAGSPDHAQLAAVGQQIGPWFRSLW